MGNAFLGGISQVHASGPTARDLELNLSMGEGNDFRAEEARKFFFETGEEVRVSDDLHPERFQLVLQLFH